MITIDHNCRTVTVDGMVMRPPRRQFDLIAYLAAHPGWVRSRPQIMDAIAIEMRHGERSVDTLVKHVRKIGVPVKSYSGIGYFIE